MKRNQKHTELSRIFKEDIEIPPKVTERIERTCEQLEHIERGENCAIMMKRKKRKWKVILAVAALCGAMSVGVMAAAGVFSWDKVEEENVTKYEVKLDKEAVAHDLKVTPTYVLEGYIKDEETADKEKYKEMYITSMLEMNPSMEEAEVCAMFEEEEERREALSPCSQVISYSKWDESGKWISGYGIEVYNATKLDNIMNFWDGNVFEYKNISGEEETRIQNLETRIFTSKDGPQRQMILMFNPIEGYIIQIAWGLDGDDLSLEEMKKVAEGLDIEILDTKLTYLSDEDREKINNEQKSMDQKVKDEDAKKRNAGVEASLVKGVGESFLSENEWSSEGNQSVEVEVTNVEVCDSVSNEEYDISHYRNYEEWVAPALNEDGTFKPHSRSVYDFDTEETIDELNINLKYVVVKVKEKNIGEEQTTIFIPFLMPLEKTKDGNYAYLDKEYRALGPEFMLQWQVGMLIMGSESIYCSEETNYQETKGQKVWGEHTLEAGEEKEYTLIYAVDEDHLSKMMLTFASDMSRGFVDIRQ